MKKIVVVGILTLSLALASCTSVKTSSSSSNTTLSTAKATISTLTTDSTQTSLETTTLSPVQSTTTVDNNSYNDVIKINECPIYYNDPLTFQNVFVYNMTSGDSITLTAGMNVWSDTVKKNIFTPDKNISLTCSKTSDFVIGKNITTITITDANHSKKTYNLVVCKYDALGTIVYNLYTAANNIYWVTEGGLLEGSSKQYDNPHGNPLFLIANYQQVMTKYFTPNGQNQFEKFEKSCNAFYRAPNGDVYSESPQRGGYDISNYILILKTATDTVMTYSVMNCDGDGKSIVGYMHDFTAKKIGSNWFIDGFTLDS